jgi:SAM-dependent methyltransferase
MQRVGKIDDLDVAAGYDRIGRHSRARIERLLPAPWSWEGKRVLDFGCGAGRTLRQFLAEADHAEFYGCDIDGPSVAWVDHHLSPPFHVFQNSEAPSLPQPDDFFDLAYALSVFTHVADEWPGWLLELHRVLKPNGLLIATFLNEGMWLDFGNGEWDEDRIGMNVTKRWNPWDSGGPIVFHSEWWLREHWGRAFDFLFVERYDPDEDQGRPKGQGAAVLRPRSNSLDATELIRPGKDPRESAALRHNVEQLQREADDLFDQLSRTAESHAALADERQRLIGEIERVRSELDRVRAELERTSHAYATIEDAYATIARSKSWRVTAPLRAGAAIMRRRTSD